ncbi:MAG: DUF3576 domain-containing protein [Rickettsiales bacterium]|nr:DUF3576 domain-containing protein [Rickettsiales bacterium]
MKKSYLILCALLFSCSVKEISHNYPDNPDYARKSRAGNAFSKNDLVVYGKKKSTEKAAAAEKTDEKSVLTKSALWQSSVGVVGALFPIAILNSDNGIITTEWYQDTPNSNERIKINALVKGPEAKKENLQITIFRQKKSVAKQSAGAWEDANRESSDTNGLSAKLLQDKILALAQKK